MTLNEKQKRFAEEYMYDLNCTQAAIRAGYSPKTAHVQGCRLLSHVKVAAYIDKMKAERSKRTGVNAERVIRELARIAFVKVSDVIDVGTGEIIDNGDDDIAAVSSVKVKRIPTAEGWGEEREVRLVDKNRALELLGKHLVMYTEKVEQSGSVSVNMTGSISVEDKLKAIEEFRAGDDNEGDENGK